MHVGNGFDGPLHFLKRRAPKGHTLHMRRHLERLGHASSRERARESERVLYNHSPLGQ